MDYRFLSDERNSANLVMEKMQMNVYELADKLDWHWDNDCRSPAVSKAADMLRQQADEIKLLRQGMKVAFDGLETIITFSKAQASIKPLTVAIDVIKDFQNSDVPPCKDYENTYDDGWMDACNEILWAIQEKVDDK